MYTLKLKVNCSIPWEGADVASNPVSMGRDFVNDVLKLRKMKSISQATEIKCESSDLDRSDDPSDYGKKQALLKFINISSLSQASKSFLNNYFIQFALRGDLRIFEDSMPRLGYGSALSNEDNENELDDFTITENQDGTQLLVEETFSRAYQFGDSRCEDVSDFMQPFNLTFLSKMQFDIENDQVLLPDNREIEVALKFDDENAYSNFVCRLQSNDTDTPGQLSLKIINCELINDKLLIDANDKNSPEKVVNNHNDPDPIQLSRWQRVKAKVRSFFSWLARISPFHSAKKGNQSIESQNQDPDPVRGPLLPEQHPRTFDLNLKILAVASFEEKQTEQTKKAQTESQHPIINQPT